MIECSSMFNFVQMNKSKADEEDYWNSSKYKAFTFDDEDDEFSTVRGLARGVAAGA